MSSRSTPAGIEVACDFCGAKVIEPHWWSPSDWLWLGSESPRRDICPEDAYRFHKEAPVGATAPKRKRRGKR